MREYALYKGDTFIDVGTLEELSKRQGIKINTLRWYKSNIAKQRDKGNRMQLIELVEDEGYTIEIPLKLPSLNEYIKASKVIKGKWNAGNDMKQKIQDQIIPYLQELPKLNKVEIAFTWVEENKRRDLDNICFAKKFILDALVKAGKLKDDNRKCVSAFTDNFEYGDKAKVILEIREV